VNKYINTFFEVYKMPYKPYEKCVGICIALILLLLCVWVISMFKKNKNLTLEGMNNFYDNRPKSTTHYSDENGVEITTLGKFGKCLVINNEIQLCDKTEHIYHEMIVHFPGQYVEKHIENVVIIGGGDLMTLREVMKYKTLKKVFMLELSEDIVSLCKKYFDQSEFEEDDRVEIIYGDANETIEDILPDYINKIDLVIVDTTEDNVDNLSIDQPVFFEKCFKLLHKEGVLVKNGLFFKHFFQDFKDLHTISYNTYIPYFQEKYVFTIASKPTYDIRKTEVQTSRWEYYNISTQFYKMKDHNKYIIYEDYVDTKNEKKDTRSTSYNKEPSTTKANMTKKDNEKRDNMSYKDDDHFKNLL